MGYIPNIFNFWVVIYVAIGATSCSYGLAIIGSTVGQPSFYASLGLEADPTAPGYARTANLIGAFNGVNAAGALVGSLGNAYLADKFSRKYTIQIGAATLIVGAALCAASINVAMFIVARIIAGFGIGILTCVIPMYQSEVSTPETRGFMVSMTGVCFAIGYMLSSWIGYGVYFISAGGSDSSFPWRFPIAFQAAPALLLLAGSKMLPFSPRWLMQNARYDEAHSVLKRLHTRKGEEMHEQAEKEFYQLKRQVEYDREISATTSAFEVFKTSSNRKRCMIACIMMFFNMFTGVLLIANYAVIMFTNLGLSGSTPLLLLAIWVSISLFGNIFTALYIDRWGRRVFMLTGIAGIFVSLLCETILQALFNGTDNKAGQRAAIFFIYLFICFWSSCQDASQFLYLSEIFPTQIRGQGTAVGMCAWYGAQIIILVAGPIALTEIGWKFLLVMLVPTGIYWFLIYFLFPETRQKSLEDINEAFGEVTIVHYAGASAAEEQEYHKALEAEMHVENVRAEPKV
ncbi:hypothetical protein LTR70_005622 [Exophiala xenobiotica]|uniref:Major facilitator superfamily (MFS) profile domain-containing protein n=1 Tax=Lithohypha guttulata TaxID=1690604 RepID=A0ABR0K971_9EURO|nr:hypothetical protein LTR24_005310 [Lithohypha guttulata]KAK5318039.1 hypothetical protein LTR70_005622 [Exophiala xenobiotica]